MSEVLVFILFYFYLSFIYAPYLCLLYFYYCLSICIYCITMLCFVVVYQPNSKCPSICRCVTTNADSLLIFQHLTDSHFTLFILTEFRNHTWICLKIFLSSLNFYCFPMKHHMLIKHIFNVSFKGFIYCSHIRLHKLETKSKVYGAVGCTVYKYVQ